MSDAPERIGLKPTYRQRYDDDWYVVMDETGVAQYIRADLHAATQAKLDKAMEALEGAYENLHEVEAGDLSTFDAQDAIADAIDALKG